jgi:signal recognition particle subunit SRP54
MQSLMGQIGQQAGMLQRLPGMKQLAMANKLRDAVKTGGLEFNPMMANLADSLLEAAVAGGGQGGLAGMPGMPGFLNRPGAPGTRKVKLDPQKRKAQRKAQKQARKKSRR